MIRCSLAGAHTFEHLDEAELVRCCVLFALAGEVQPQRIGGGSTPIKPSLRRLHTCGAEGNGAGAVDFSLRHRQIPQVDMQRLLLRGGTSI
jgi:hypothetical protein